jgi:hypothetical protein
MVTFRNNSRRGRFRSNDRNFKRNGDNQKFKSDFSSNVNFQRKVPGRNNHNAPKLVEKYNDLAKEALANEDKILSENYFQHADHFIRILNEQEKNRPVKPIEGFHKNEKEVSLQEKENKEQEKQAASS